VAKIVNYGKLFRRINPSISTSSLGRYNSCPSSYYRQYILKEEFAEEKGIPAIRGISIHKCIEDFYNSCNFDRQNLISNWKETFKHTIEKEQVVISEDEQQKILTEGYQILNTFYNEQEKEGLLKKPLFNEKYLKTVYRGIVVKAKVDMIINWKDVMYIYDFKTNWHKYGKKELNENLQAHLNLWLYKLTYKKEAKFCFHFIRLKQRQYIEKLNEELLLSVIDKLLDSHIHNNFPIKPNDCKYCMYQSRCEYFTKQKTIRIS
jgi:ATP-dependent helicase/DNAse subunit B